MKAARLLSCACLLLAPKAWAANPSALWNITNDQCVPHQRDKGDPKPCALADLEHGYVILKDIVGKTQFLLMPVARIGGIESPEILAPNAPNFWRDAWAARHFAEEKAGHPLARDVMSLSVNSPSGRTQNQLHIHIDCVRADVRDALAANQDEIKTTWTPFPVPLAGFPWRALRLTGEDLPDDPFRLLAADGAVMADHTLAVVGMMFADGQPGFVVLDGQADPLAGNRGSSEVLQDHDCALGQ